MDIEAYRHQLFSLLPPGDAFPREDGTELSLFLYAVAIELSRLDGRAQDLLAESYPLTSDETLTDWERITGLPAACILSDQTKQERREAVHTKLGTVGAQSRKFFINLAASIGYEITIKEFRPMKCVDDCTSRVYSKDWVHVWEVNAPEVTVKILNCGGACDEPLRKWSNELLECMMSQFQPAHTQILHTYGSSDL